LLDIQQDVYKPLVIRVIFGFLSDIFLFFALSLTTYSKATAIFFTNTLMIPFMARFILKEQMLKTDVIGIVIGFIGMFLIVQPFSVVSGGEDALTNTDS